ncbi:hypothetical protein ASF69_01500 [Rhizobium sp. Leaf311]|uniref:hypothetical protein n=1 Tax=Rhizobium sp. Leaf311 TaxID=1736332 RepID=UPI0007160AEF|nr:hypothetical protein [Rhizobium sp. Leaf311]KQQ61125.1 hypothetical protein ASF69_01500 [Rhizobium sp. Leaf311]
MAVGALFGDKIANVIGIPEAAPVAEVKHVRSGTVIVRLEIAKFDNPADLRLFYLDAKFVMQTWMQQNPTS